MRALVRHGTVGIRCDTVPDPKIEDDRDAMVKVTRCAICGSDLHLHDHFMPGIKQGGIIGHETMAAARLDIPAGQAGRAAAAMPPPQRAG